jgi:ferritin
MDNTLTQAIQEWHTTERQNMAAYDALFAQADNVNWPGLAHWCKQSADDEREHAAKVAAFLVDKNILPETQPLEAVTPPTGDDHATFFQVAMTREVLTDQTIKEIYGMALEAGEYDTCEFANWFLAEQRRSIREIADYLKMLARPVDALVFDNSLND